MGPKKVAAIVLIVVAIFSIAILGGNWGTIFVQKKNVPPQQVITPHMAAYYANSSLTMHIENISIVRSDAIYHTQSFNESMILQPFIQVSYTLLANGQPIKEYVDDANVLYNRLDWNNFSVTVDGVNTAFEHDKYIKCVFSPVHLMQVTNVSVRYRSEEMKRQFNATQIRYVMSSIPLNTQTVTDITNSDPFATIQKVVDNYAIVISGFIFLKDDLSELERKFTSMEEWYAWLTYASNNAASVTDALHNFENYANSTGVVDLINNVWIELRALATSSDEFSIIYTQHLDSVTTAIAKHAVSGLNDPTELLDLLNKLGGMSSGETLYTAIQGTIDEMQWVYAQLAVDCFNWIANTTRTEVTRGNPAWWHIDYYANGSEWYFDNLESVRGWTGYYGPLFGEINHNPFPIIIETNMQCIDVGERGVAWWPADYCARFIPPDYIGYIDNTPFQTDSRGHDSSLPTTNVKCSGYYGGTYLVFLATKSMVLGYLKENGFHLLYLPPTPQEAKEFLQFWDVSQYVKSQAGSDSNLFLNNETADEVKAMSAPFDNPESIYVSLVTVRKYHDATVFLEQINENSWQVNG